MPANDAGTVSGFSPGPARMMAVKVVICLELGLTVSNNKTEIMRLWSGRERPHGTRRRQASGAGRRPSLSTVVVSAVNARVFQSIPSVALVPRGERLPNHISQVCDRPNVQLSFSIRLVKAV